MTKLVFRQTENATVSSETIPDPDEPHFSGRDDAQDDPSWVPCDQKEKKKPETFQMTCRQKEWMKPVVFACDRANLSEDYIFHILCSLLVGNGVNIDDVIISPSIIKELRREVQLETDATIKVEQVCMANHCD